MSDLSTGAADRAERMAWWHDAKFGMFVHWGIYAIPGWHEQHQWRGWTPAHDYVKLAEQWNPVNYSPDAWLDLAEEAGIRYVFSGPLVRSSYLAEHVFDDVSILPK